jgi:hypothetical protein
MQNRRKRFPTGLGLWALFGPFLVVGLAVSAAAQGRPNFTGDWTLDLKTSQLHEDYRALERGVVRIDHHEPTFIFRRTFFVKERPIEASYDVTTDGQEHRGVGPNGGVTVATTHWEQMALVVEQRISDPNAGQLTNRVRYELMDKGQTLQATEDFEGGGRSHHNVWIFRRQ